MKKKKYTKIYIFFFLIRESFCLLLSIFLFHPNIKGGLSHSLLKFRSYPGSSTVSCWSALEHGTYRRLLTLKLCDHP